MTCIVGLTYPATKELVLACDSAVSWPGEGISRDTERKVFAPPWLPRGTALLGVSGRVVDTQTLRWGVADCDCDPLVDLSPRNVREFVTRIVVRRMKDALDAMGLLRTEAASVTSPPSSASTCLLGLQTYAPDGSVVAPRLFTIACDLSVVEDALGYAAIGSGSIIARAVIATQNVLRAASSWRARLATLSKVFDVISCDGVRPPWHAVRLAASALPGSGAAPVGEADAPAEALGGSAPAHVHGRPRKGRRESARAKDGSASAAGPEAPENG